MSHEDILQVWTAFFHRLWRAVHIQWLPQPSDQRQLYHSVYQVHTLQHQQPGQQHAGGCEHSWMLPCLVLHMKVRTNDPFIYLPFHFQWYLPFSWQMTRAASSWTHLLRWAWRWALRQRKKRWRSMPRKRGRRHRWTGWRNMSCSVISKSFLSNTSKTKGQSSLQSEWIRFSHGEPRWHIQQTTFSSWN